MMIPVFSPRIRGKGGGQGSSPPQESKKRLDCGFPRFPRIVPAVPKGSGKRRYGEYFFRSLKKTCRSVLLPVSVEPCAHRHGIVDKRDGDGAVLSLARDQHAAGIHPAELGRFEVGDEDDLFADEILRLVILGDAGDDLAPVCAIVELKLQELLCLHR